MSDNFGEFIKQKELKLKFSREPLLKKQEFQPCMPTVTYDIAEYINSNKQVHDVLRFSKEQVVSDEDWQEFMDLIRNKYLQIRKELSDF